MKTALSLTVAAWLLGQTATEVPGMPGWAGLVANLSATALLFWLFGWLMTRQIPRERAEVREQAKSDRKEEREHTEQVIAKIAAAFDRSMEAIAEEHNRATEKQAVALEKQAMALESLNDIIAACKFRQGA